jgi:hypothetical protein
MRVVANVAPGGHAAEAPRQNFRGRRSLQASLLFACRRFGAAEGRTSASAVRGAIGRRSRHNMAVDSDAQLRMLPAVAPVGRRSLLR